MHRYCTALKQVQLSLAKTGIAAYGVFKCYKGCQEPSQAKKNFRLALYMDIPLYNLKNKGFLMNWLTYFILENLKPLQCPSST